MSIFYVPGIMLGMMNTVVYKTDMAFLYLIEFILHLGKPKKNKPSNKYFNHSKYKEEETHVEFN